jgi:hypothetical protein
MHLHLQNLWRWKLAAIITKLVAIFTSCASTAWAWLLQDLQIPEVKRLAAEATLASSEAETQRLWQQVDARSAGLPRTHPCAYVVWVVSAGVHGPGRLLFQLAY